MKSVWKKRIWNESRNDPGNGKSNGDIFPNHLPLHPILLRNLRPPGFRLHFFFPGLAGLVFIIIGAVQALLCFLISFLGLISRINNQLIRIRMIPPRYSPTTNCQPRKIEIMIPNSITRLVDARRNAIEETKLAPFLNKLLVEARAAKLQELLMKPKKKCLTKLPSIRFFPWFAAFVFR